MTKFGGDVQSYKVNMEVCNLALRSLTIPTELDCEQHQDEALRCSVLLPTFCHYIFFSRSH